MYIYLSRRDIYLKSLSSLLIDEMAFKYYMDLPLIGPMPFLLSGVKSSSRVYIPTIMASILRRIPRFHLYTTSLHLTNFIRSCYKILDDVPRDARNVANAVKRFLENTKRAMDDMPKTSTSGPLAN